MEPDHTSEPAILEWLSVTSSGASVAAIARAADMPQRTLANHVKKGQLPAEVAVAIARAYDADPVWALVANGYLRDSEVSRFASEMAAHELPLRPMLTALVDRLDHLASVAHLATSAPEGLRTAGETFAMLFEEEYTAFGQPAAGKGAMAPDYEPPRSSHPSIRLLSDDAPEGWEEMPYAAGRTEDPGEDD